MTRILISTTCYKKELLDDVFQIFKALDFSHIDLNLDPLYFGKTDADSVLSILKPQQLSVELLSGGWCDFFVTGAELDEVFTSIEKQIRFARQLNCANLRLFFGRLALEDFSDAMLNVICSNILAVSKRYREINFVFENHDGASLSPEVCKSILENINQANIKMNFDPINFEKAGVTAKHALDLLMPHIAHVHLKGLKGKEYCAYGDGDVNLDPTIRHLLQENYAGKFTLEYEGNQDATLHLFQAKTKFQNLLKSSASL